MIGLRWYIVIYESYITYWRTKNREKRRCSWLKDGFAHNVLISKGKAILATPQALSQLEAKINKRKREKQEEEKAFKELILKVNDITVSIKAKANEKGILFKCSRCIFL